MLELPIKIMSHENLTKRRGKQHQTLKCRKVMLTGVDRVLSLTWGKTINSNLAPMYVCSASLAWKWLLLKTLCMLPEERATTDAEPKKRKEELFNATGERKKKGSEQWDALCDVNKKTSLCGAHSLSVNMFIRSRKLY